MDVLNEIALLEYGKPYNSLSEECKNEINMMAEDVGFHDY